MIPIYLLFVAGALGAFIKDVVEDEKIKIPCKINGYLSLGFIGSMIIGALIGYIDDGSFLTAFMAGYCALSIEQALTHRKDLSKSE